MSRYVAVVFLVISTVMVGWTDPQFNPMGYRWVVIHILSVGKDLLTLIQLDTCIVATHLQC